MSDSDDDFASPDAFTPAKRGNKTTILSQDSDGPSKRARGDDSDVQMPLSQSGRPLRTVSSSRKVVRDSSGSDSEDYSESNASSSEGLDESEESDVESDEKPVKAKLPRSKVPAAVARKPATAPSKRAQITPKKGEMLSFKSPAEFFAENQNIAGFDNPGKAMYTTIRELVENSLDAAEAIGRLPDIEVVIEEMTQSEFNSVRGITAGPRVDHGLYSLPAAGKAASSAAVASASQDAPASQDPPAGVAAKKPRSNEAMYYRITCKDNGCGLKHEVIPSAFGVVLAGSKYGVRQTRGKFGLGAKMALIWSRKSTGLPIEIRSAYSPNANSEPKDLSYCKLDIDIYKNKPNVISHLKLANTAGWNGTEISLYISGAWSTYKSRVMSYMTQLAIITPYAQFDLRYQCLGSPSKNFSVRFTRRSLQMPPPAKEIKHHPSAVNDLLVKQLMDATPDLSLTKFMKTQLSSINGELASRLITELGRDFDGDMTVSELTPKQIHQIVALFRVAKFPAPRGDCLSPAGEYNLRLGIMKEVLPELVATHCESAAVCDGHPFIVEAGVSIGGRDAKEGITVYRFANRIPLLFEGGGDVVTRTAMKRIKWSQYKMDHKRDKIGVFVSIVSTKIPFKGTGKEYIGDDVEEIANAVKHALQSCCSQLRVKLQHRSDVSSRASRRKELLKYVPDTARSVMGVLKEILRRRKEAESGVGHTLSEHETKMIEDVAKGSITEVVLHAKLREAVEKSDAEAALEHAATTGRSKANIEGIFIRPILEPSVDAPTIKNPTLAFQLSSSFRLELTD